MANTTVIKVVHNEAAGDVSNAFGFPTAKAREACVGVAQYLEAAAGGARNITLKVSSCEVDGVKATGTVTISSGSGTVSITINGVAFSRTWATSDTVTAAAFATSINASANALIAGVVTATSALGVVTITAVDKSILGNAVTTAAAGTGMTADQARLTGGVSPTFTTYTLGL